ncbi:MAG: polyphosphate kinase 2 family protein [Daejeonella sp.]|uniref:polyphosphate kinase 2 family protein n=1 Tax=Daejeonella sp. TaxID=2805397 RepID=UPI002736FBAA|nr:polyphosphate kinase 2 family protein [Daejeonella sp.]MDP3466769.1 polyphosphate kinase 2 family protein [Daejeonella sp.]
MDAIINQFKITKGAPFSLKEHDPGFSGDYKKDKAINLLEELGAEMANLQEEMYALNKNSLLIIFQAMDAAGKDSAIGHTMSGLNPQGCQVYSFKQPSAEELDHDFIWRHYKALPERGRVGIHNRSHYENVLVCKVHPEYVLNEGIAGVESLKDINAAFWEKRFESIRDFEKHLSRNGTVVIKFFLNVSKEEQKKRFLERIDQPLKNWKFSSADIDERQKWDQYMIAYEEAIKATTEEHAPWYVVPADKKWFTRIAISRIIVDTFKEMNMKLPELSEAEKARLEECRKRLTDEK